MAQELSGDNEEIAREGRQVDDVGLHELGARLSDLGEELRVIGGHATSQKIADAWETVERSGHHEHAVDEYEQRVREAVRRTLAGMGSFRKDYANWERLVVEYALTKQGFTQREVARLLGVGLSTVNRWAQHPLSYEE